MEAIATRKGDLKNMTDDQHGRIRLDYVIPSRGLIGFHTDFQTITSGTGLMYHSFDHYGPYKGGKIGGRNNGVMIANAKGKATGYAI